MRVSSSVWFASTLCLLAAVATLAAVPYANACNNRLPQKIFCAGEPASNCGGFGIPGFCSVFKANVADKEGDFGETSENATGEKTTQTTAENGSVCYSYNKCKSEGGMCVAGDAAESKAAIYVGSKC